ncbi:MAG: hypothetical protein F4Y82_05955 [Cenarchaeum sp. SB0665_bin_23]|nr:hypothetical protein [Cenarchaeum sp. SB0665_bin_23]MXZ94126.1 hypothetical protein [Cenarchaeum sp. SB0666_bin_15]MYC79579.1 hypothetical protein [Cenarchaeum sp. SB0661_bin_35]MYG32913.1 hypothetical protein [Cenarchaeum sp. SB0677_bin_16]
MIAQFLRWMSDEGLVNLDDITKNNLDGFHTRFRIQKCMFIAQHLGLDAGYSYNRYKHGPYSPTLAKDYYGFANKKADVDKEFDFSEAAACHDMMKHDNDWLEIGTTLIHASKGHNSIDPLIEYVECIKYPYSRKYIESVFDDLRETKIARIFDRLVV